MADKLTQGQRIRKLRIERRYTQEYLADRLGTTKQAIYKYEADIVKRIPADKLLRLAQLLGCSVGWLDGSSEELGSAPEAAFLMPRPAPENDPFSFYQQLMAVIGQLSPEERCTTMKFAQFLLTQHEKTN